jgi:flagellar hook assembly protein FlgD
LPNDKVSQVKVVIYDNTGNVVFERSEKKDKFSWNLTNSAGRNVANGTYLAVAEVKGGSGKTYVYSAKLGIKR